MQANRWYSAAAQMPEHSSRLSSTAALPMSLARLDRSCHSGPMRSIAASMAVLSNSTIITISTEPASSAVSTQLRPSQKASGHQHAGGQGLLAKSGFAPARAQAGEREAGGMPDPAQAGAHLLLVGG